MFVRGLRAGAVLRAVAMALAPIAAGACSSGAGDQAGSGSGTAVEQGMQDASALGGSRWRAEEVGGRAVAEGVQSTLVFDRAGRVSGSGGCNRFSGPVEVGAGSIRFGALAATRMACPPPGMEQEDRYFAALARSERWRVDADGRLVLMDAAGGPVVVFRRQPS